MNLVKLLVLVVSVVSTSGCFALSNVLANVFSPPGKNKIAASNPLRSNEALVLGRSLRTDASCAPSSYEGNGVRVTAVEGQLCVEDRLIMPASSSPMDIVLGLESPTGRSADVVLERRATGIAATCTTSGGLVQQQVFEARGCVPNGGVLIDTSAWLALQLRSPGSYELARFVLTP